MKKKKKYYQKYFRYRDLIHLFPRISERDAAFIKRAYLLAETYHDGQTREPRTPFFYHPTRVAQFVLSLGKIYKAEVVAAALLHDTVESTSLTLEEIRDELSPRVAKMVDILTKPWKRVKKRAKSNGTYIRRIARSDDYCRLIKLCDRIDNLRSLPFNPTKKPAAYISETYKKHVEEIGSSSRSIKVKRARSVLIDLCKKMEEKLL